MNDGTSKDPVKVAAGKMGGRPATVQGGERLTVRLSSELHAEFEAMRAKVRARGRELSTSEALRWAVKLLVDSPGDVIQAIVEDPKAERVEAVERPSTEAPSRAAAASPVRERRGRRGGETAATA